MTIYDTRSWSVPTSFSDTQIEPWMFVTPESATAQNRDSSAAAIKREELIAAATGRLSGYLKKGVTDVAIQNAAAAIAFLTTDDCATPQVGLDGEGGVETDWVVDGRSLVLNCTADGTNLLWAMDKRGKLLFRHAFNVKWMMSDQVVGEACTFLEDLSKGVRRRVSAKA
jgi:hypothetical protein